jgi:hypothetical protein
MVMIRVLNLALAGILICRGGFGGNEGAHGGAGIYCTQAAANDLNGFYMLDYVIMRGGPGDHDWPYPAAFTSMTDYNQVLDWILAGIHDKLPVLAADLRDFRSTVFTNIPGNPPRWIPRLHLPRIWDQGLGLQPWESDEEVNFPSRSLPLNCKFRDIVQTAVKYRAGRYVAFAYVPALVDQLGDTGPVQVSYLIVHEWLRNYTNDAEVIRRANRLLHSTAITSLNQSQLRQMLREIGLF